MDIKLPCKLVNFTFPHPLPELTRKQTHLWGRRVCKRVGESRGAFFLTQNDAIDCRFLCGNKKLTAISVVLHFHLANQGSLLWSLFTAPCRSFLRPRQTYRRLAAWWCVVLCSVVVLSSRGSLCSPPFSTLAVAVLSTRSSSLLA